MGDYTGKFDDSKLGEFDQRRVNEMCLRMREASLNYDSCRRSLEAAKEHVTTLTLELERHQAICQSARLDLHGAVMGWPYLAKES